MKKMLLLILAMGFISCSTVNKPEEDRSSEVTDITKLSKHCQNRPDLIKRYGKDCKYKRSTSRNVGTN